MLPTLAILLERLGLTLRLCTALPSVDVVDAYEHAAAAIAAATPEVNVELLLAVAFVESRYDPTATSRVENGTRKTGRFPSLQPPRDLDPGTSLYCGPLQTYAGSWKACVALRDVPAAYAAGAAEIGSWLRDRRVRGDIARALAGHGCGNHGVTTGKCNRYPARVLWIERKLSAPQPRSQPRS